MGKDLKGKELGKGFCQRKDGRYMYRYTSVTGVRKTVYEYSITKLRAMVKNIKSIDLLENADEDYFLDSNLINLRNKLREKKKAEKKQKDDKRTLNEIFNLWITQREELEDIKLTTINLYKNVYRGKLMKELGEKQYKGITPSDYNKFIIKTSKTKKATIEICIIKGLYKYAYDFGIFEEDYSGKINKPKNKKAKEKSIISYKDYEIIINNCESERLKNFIIIAYYTGMRKSEIAGIENKDINFDENIIMVNKQVVFTGGRAIFQTTKNGKNRIVPFNNECKQALLSQLSILEEVYYQKSGEFKDLIFFGKNNINSAYTSMAVEFKNLLNKLKKEGILNKDVDISLHSLRHTYITNCVESGMNQKAIEKIVGHSDVKMTDHYTHISNDFVTNDFFNHFKNWCQIGVK